MAGIVPVFLLLDKASMYTFLDLAFELVDVVLWGGVWTPPNHKPFKLRSQKDPEPLREYPRRGEHPRENRSMPIQN